MGMEGNLPTVIVSLPTLSTLPALVAFSTIVSLVAGGVGLCKPRCNLRGGAGSQENGWEDQLHCCFGLFFNLQVFSLGSFHCLRFPIISNTLFPVSVWAQLIIHLLQLGAKVLQYKPNLPLSQWAPRRMALFACSFAFLDSQFGECWVLP